MSYTEQYIPYIRAHVGRIFRKYAGQHSFDDLLQTAMLASLEAEQAYDPSKADFSTYVRKRIDGAIVQYTTGSTPTEHYRANKIKKFIEQYVEEHNAYPSADQISAGVQLALSIVIQSIKQAGIQFVDIDSISVTGDEEQVFEYDNLYDVIERLAKDEQTAVLAFMHQEDYNEAHLQSGLKKLKQWMK